MHSEASCEAKPEAKPSCSLPAWPWHGMYKQHTAVMLMDALCRHACSPVCSAVHKYHSARMVSDALCMHADSLARYMHHTALIVSDALCLPESIPPAACIHSVATHEAKRKRISHASRRLH
jgi:hypothetical protein